MEIQATQLLSLFLIGMIVGGIKWLHYWYTTKNSIFGADSIDLALALFTICVCTVAVLWVNEIITIV